jgi:hypothetical protein
MSVIGRGCPESGIFISLYRSSEHFSPPERTYEQEITSDAASCRGPMTGEAMSDLDKIALGSSYLKTAWRKMRRQKGYSFINIASLAVGLAGALFIWLWVQDELSFDRFHANAPSLFRVEQDQIGGQGTFHVYVTQYPMGPAIQSAIPEIKRSVRYAWTSGLLVRHGEKAFFEDAVRAVDPGFLESFTFPLVRGDRASALSGPSSVILTEETAVKYFGPEDPIGKTLVVNNVHSLAVTGVAKNVPANSTSHLRHAGPVRVPAVPGDRHRPLGGQLHHHLRRAQRSRLGCRRRREDDRLHDGALL